jgi:hypothetical protein
VWYNTRTKAWPRGRLKIEAPKQRLPHTPIGAARRVHGIKAMDAATLYVVLTLPIGMQKTKIVGEPTLASCLSDTETLRELKRSDPKAPVVRYWCAAKSPPVLPADDDLPPTE